MAEIKQLTLRLPEDLEPLFVNMVRVAHTPGEFILDFSAILPGSADPKVDARIILSPLGVKLMQQAINENIRRYEKTYGEIRLPTAAHTLADDLFSHPNNIPPEGS
ncbi:MAG: DUF3467 domain-containing protein [Anaerolineaceae bacterium]